MMIKTKDLLPGDMFLIFCCRCTKSGGTIETALCKEPCQEEQFKKDSHIQTQTAWLAKKHYTTVHCVSGCKHNLMNTENIEVLNR